MRGIMLAAIALTLGCLATGEAAANDYREKGKPARVAKSAMTVTPPRDWNQLAVKPGKNAETWTLDGEQLNDVTFFGGIGAGQPLVKERNRKREPLPRFSSTTLLVEIPELLGTTYRAYRKISQFSVTGSKPDRFLNRDGIRFTYEYVDQDDLPRRGEALAALVSGKLYMMTFDAPRLHYYDRALADYRALALSATL